MLFNSIQFILFLIIVSIVYYLLPYKFRWVMLLMASYYFYMCWEPKFVLLILFSTIVHYFAALGINRIDKENNVTKGDVKKKIILFFSIGTSILILFVFKYFDFFSLSAARILKCCGLAVHPMTLNLILPMGISFYTFQTLSYTLDVYYNRILPEKHFGYFALYISFFPQLVAGPIERADRLIPQLKKKQKFDYEQVTYGLKLMAIGYFKKIVVADTLAKGVDRIYNNVGNYTGLVLGMATIMFAIQIYCDFSGYSDIAIGCANIMGIRLMKNFDSPYLSVSIKEFWQRWHISLSTWFRDYVYIPLGGNRKGVAKTYRNLMVTFLLSGLWHGADWTYIIWGGIHGAYQIIENAAGRYVGKGVKSGKTNIIVRGFRRLFTFGLVCFAWIFFRANTIKDAFYIITNMFAGISEPKKYLKDGILSFENYSVIGILIFEIVLLILIDIFQKSYDLINVISQKTCFVRWAIYIIFCTIIVFFASRGTTKAFIYFQF